MNRNLWLLAAVQGLFLTNNIVFIAINGLVGLHLAPHGWMATLPVMGYVVGGALSTGLVAASQRRWGRKVSFQLGLLVALVSALSCALAVMHGNFWLLLATTVVAGFYSANGQLYRFAAGELAALAHREKAVSLVLAGGLIGAVTGPNLANLTRNLLSVPFAGAYLTLAAVALLSMLLMAFIRFPPVVPATANTPKGRTLSQLMQQPAFLVSMLAAALGYGVMNLLMAATPLAMQLCKYPFSDVALVLEWHVIGMFAPGFFTGHLIRRLGVLPVMLAGVVLNAACIAVALSGQDVHQFVIALLLLGMGWNLLFTGSTTLAMQTYQPEEKDRAQAIINFGVFATMAVTAFASGALVTASGWKLLNQVSLLLVLFTGSALVWLGIRQKRRRASQHKN
ncbi:MFS transporter [Leeia oryzae]|uniref:MFS transporter n=1 Tax=Leeia oryzae TaxID=356662 RepID=UPI0003AA090F|nr:MFS transporter [Leeia oryzae]